MKDNPSDAKIEAQYRRAEVRNRTLIRDFELKSENRVIRDNIVGSFYKFVNKRLSSKHGIGALRRCNGELVTDGRANLLNDFSALFVPLTMELCRTLTVWSATA